MTVAGALTNGSSVIEPFGFYDETDSNAGKTVSGRVSIIPPLPFRLELGFSGLYGAQDRALDSRHPIWFAGADLQVSWSRLWLAAEFLRGSSDGEVGPAIDLAHRVYGLRLNNGGYVQLVGAVWRVRRRSGPRGVARCVRLARRSDAARGAERLYVTKSWRLTGGLRFAISERVVAKIEYLHNGEYGGVPPIPNDVLTSSVVMTY